MSFSDLRCCNLTCINTGPHCFVDLRCDLSIYIKGYSYEIPWDKKDGLDNECGLRV